MIKWLTIVLSLIGVGIGVVAVAASQEKKVDLPLARAPTVNPFDRGIASLGLVEPAGRVINVLPPESGVVTAVFVDVNDHVKAGQELLRLDDRTLRAELIRAEATIAGAEAAIARWHALPRPEDLPPLEAALARADAELRDREEQLRLNEAAAQRGGATGRDVSLIRFSVEAARAARGQAAADLDRIRAGGWAPDLVVVEADLARRRAEVEALRLLLDRQTVRAPSDGVVLRRSIEPGETATIDTARPALTLGDLSRLRVRAQVDEEDIGLLAGSTAPRAEARTRGARQRVIPLRFVRIEPFARPKSDLSGSNVERVDTRVIDVVFEVNAQSAGYLYPGQAVDVFIEAQGLAPADPGATP